MNSGGPILVIGGTRGTGLLIARLLVRQGRGVRVFARNRARALRRLDPEVEVVEGDLTKPETLGPAVDGARHIIITAGCRSGHPVGEARVKAVEYEGTLALLAAAQRASFAGRLLYMTASGLTTPSLLARCLNLWKGNTLIWRRRVEAPIRSSGLDYTIIRTGVLLNRPGGRHRIRIVQQALPLAWRHRIARADVAALFVAAVDHPQTTRASFEVVWGPRGQSEPLRDLLDQVTPSETQQGIP